MMLRLANGFAQGAPGVRPELAQLVVDALNDGSTPRVRILGSVGQADLSANADLAHGLLGDFALAEGEALALLNNNAFSTAVATLAVADYASLLDSWTSQGRSTWRRSRPTRARSTPRSATRARIPGCARRSNACASCSTAAPLERPAAEPPGPAVVPVAPAGARGGARRARVRAGSPLDRAQLPPGKPTRRRRRRARRLGRELRRRPARGRARLPPHRPCARADECCRACAQAPAGAADRTSGRARRPRRPRRPGPQRAGRRRAGARRRGAAPRPAGVLRARELVAARGDRGPDDDGAARRAPARGDGRPGRQGHRSRAHDRRPGRRPAKALGPRRGNETGTRAGSRARPFHGRGRGAAAGPRAARRARPLRAPFLAHDCRRRPPAPVARVVRRGARPPRAAAAPPRLDPGAGHRARRRDRPGAHDLDARLRLLDRCEIDVAIVSLQPTLGVADLPEEERAELVASYESGIREVAAAAAGRIVALGAGGPKLDGFAGSCVGSAGAPGSRPGRAAARRARTARRLPLRPPRPAAVASAPDRLVARGRRLHGADAGRVRRVARRRRRAVAGASASSSRSSRAAGPSSSSACAPTASRAASSCTRTSSSRRPPTGAGRSTSASRPTGSASSCTEATRPSSIPSRPWTPSGASAML